MPVVPHVLMIVQQCRVVFACLSGWFHILVDTLEFILSRCSVILFYRVRAPPGNSGHHIACGIRLAAGRGSALLSPERGLGDVVSGTSLSPTIGVDGLS